MYILVLTEERFCKPRISHLIGKNAHASYYLNFHIFANHIMLQGNQCYTACLLHLNCANIFAAIYFTLRSPYSKMTL